MDDMSFDTIIRGGSLATPGGLLRVDLGISDGKVAGWLVDKRGESEQTIEADGCVVIPGLVDCHVHIREPGAPEKEDFASGTSAAASAGITTLIVMPNTSPPIDNAATFREVMRLGESKSVVDFAIAAEAHPAKVTEYRDLRDLGAASFDISMLSFPEQTGVGLLEVMREVSRLGVPLGVFCADRFIVERSTKVLRDEQGRKDFLAHAETYPEAAEAASLARVLELAKTSGARLHVRQVSTRSAVRLLGYAKSTGMKLTAEVNPHHLYLTSADLGRLGPVAKMIPPLRDHEDTLALWDALSQGVLDVVSTDHAPHRDDEKVQAVSDVWKAPSGIPGVETLLPLLLRAVHEGKIDWEQMVRIVCESPARLFGFYPQKGTLLPGSDADLVILDPKKEWVFDSREAISKAKLTPFSGWKFIGKPIMTWVRGQLIFNQGKVVVRPGTGKFVHPVERRSFRVQ